MNAAAFFVALAALIAVAIAAIFIGTAISERRCAAILTITSLTVAVAVMALGLHVSTGWIAAALALASAFTLAWGQLGRRLVWVVGPALMLGAHSAWSLLSAVLSSMAAASVLALLMIGCPLTGLWLRRLRLLDWFADLSALSLLAGLALMAGPVFSMGWRRAAIAAEGQGAVAISEPILIWPLAIAVTAFAVGLGWKLIINPRDLQ